MSSYITVTYSQRDALTFQPLFDHLRIYFKEISNKNCLNIIIPGVMSRSFQFINEAQATIISKELFKNRSVWIKCGLKSNPQTGLQLQTGSTGGNLWGISFGYLASIDDFKWKDKINANFNLLQWRLDSREKRLVIKYNNVFELRLTQDCLDKYFIVSNNISPFHAIILPLKTAPRCYCHRQSPLGTRYERILTFDHIDKSCLADSSVLWLRFPCQISLATCENFLVDVMKLDCHYHQGSINASEMTKQTFDYKLTSSDFWSSYAYQMLLSLGYRIKNMIDTLTFFKINHLSSISKNEHYPNHQCYLKLMAIYYHARHNRFFDINQEYDNIQPMRPGIILNKWEYVPRVYLTPYGIYPLPIKPMRGNRILRERELFGPAEHFCRVIIRDVDLGQPQQDFMNIIQEWIKNLIIGKEHVMIGMKPFLFLLCSNSQLRDRSFWFHSFYQGLGAEHIRRWMGDFSSETCVGTRIARMALSLTGTTPTITLSPDQMECIDDKFDTNGRNFTDGAGRISPKALKKALMAYNPELIQDNYMPCVIQARLNGIKGIFVLAPDLDNRDILIQYRNSQYKFKSDHNVLEIVKHSSSGMAFLNRQVIILLENMGVRESVFLNLQNKTRVRISMSLLANQTAQHTLEQNIRSYDWERMRKSGIQLTKEPFIRSLLLLLAQERLKRLKEKSHVQIPLSDGRMLLGVPDETNSLQYGQVFIQLRDLNGERQIIRKRKVLITKNPAHFPGDMRILDAVDCPKLHHLYECVVFPAQGERPHSNEISGSDLDGDEYWVCWNEDLVKSVKAQYPPATFDSAGKLKHDGEITMIEIADFLFKYLSSDALGVLSNRHLACCALHGANHDNSMRLARIISEAVDFPKTGILPKNPTDIKLQQYPDFMENKYKSSFKSKSSIGTMYRQVKDVWEIHSTFQETLEGQIILINQDFIIEGYQKYINETKIDYEYYASRMNSMLSIYNLGSETELITGCHLCPEEEKKNNDSVETALLEFRELIREMRVKFAVNKLSHIERLRKASAWYYVAYTAGTFLSFGWIMDQLMGDIIKRKQLPQEEHQALKRIGKAIRIQGYEKCIKDAANAFNIQNGEHENLSDTGTLGFQFLKILDYCNGSSNVQEYAHRFLTFLHRVALDIV